jgi:hypothetical protein
VSTSTGRAARSVITTTIGRHIIVTGLTLAFGDTAGGFPRLIQIVFGLSIAFAVPSFSALRRRRADLMAQQSIDRFEAPVHRTLTNPILLAGPPRAVAIVNGTLSAAIVLGPRLGDF